MAKRAARPEAPSRQPTTPPRGLAGTRARLSVDDPSTSILNAITQTFPEDDLDWRRLDLDDKTFDRALPSDLLERLANLSPEMACAIWHFLRFSNGGWELDVWRPGSNKVTDERAKAQLEAFFARLADLYGSIDVVWNRLYIGVFLRGALFGELVFDQSGRQAIDIATPDPKHVHFERRQDPVRGSVWVPYQWQSGRRVYLDSPFIRYVPLDPLPGKPWGRALATPALFACLFALGLLRDLRRVVAQQGYPRLDIEFSTEMMSAWAQKFGIDHDPDKLREFVKGLMDDVKEEYRQLQPDDALLHTNVSKVNRPVGTLGAEALGAVDGLMRAIERVEVRALKSAPFLFGLSESTTETQSNRQMDAMLNGIRAVQHLAEGVIEYFGRLALQAEGIVADVQFRFAEIRASEALRDAQVEEIRIRNEIAKMLFGWTTQEQAAAAAADVEEPAEAAPLFVPRNYVAADGGGGAVEEPEPLGTLPGEEAEGEGEDRIAGLLNLMKRGLDLPASRERERALEMLADLILKALPREEEQEQERRRRRKIEQIIARIRRQAMRDGGDDTVDILEEMLRHPTPPARRDPFTPADTDLPPLDEDAAEVQAADISASVRAWDDASVYAGLLDAEVVG